MEKKELTIEGPVTAGNARVYVAAETRITCDSVGDRLMCSAARVPTYILIVSDAGKKAFTADGEEVAMERLMEDVPGIEELLADRDA